MRAVPIPERALERSRPRRAELAGLPVQRPDADGGTAGREGFWRGNNFNENVTGKDDGYSHAYTAGEATLTDVANTVETVFIPARTFKAGEKITIRVTGTLVPQGPQGFSIYAYNVRR